ncbi:MAG TPA: TetR/AcrR family transcriptional regulator [Solirubrobacteraceae bacterium]|nr:TetR/AcrR family transcriptional regulator [Solirubrobacteraceae bacterium]
MATAAKNTRQRVPAEERRDALIDAAIPEFAHGGLHGTPVADIARRVGVAQPYVFTLFPTKRDLFIAAVDRCFDRVIAMFEQVAAGFEPDPDDEEGLIKAFGDAYMELLGSDRSVLMLQLHAYAACGDDEVVRENVNAGYTRLSQRVQALTGMDDLKLNEFLSIGTWLTVQAAIHGELSAEACDWLEARKAQGL